MKILLVLGKYLPEKNGGIENYSHGLAMLLSQNGHRVEVAILDGNEMQPYTYEEINIIPLKKGFDSFTSLIQENHYDICHIQEYSGENGIHIEWFRIAKLYCEKVFFTFHLPYLTCYKNDFRYLGIEDCHTFNSAARCAKCIIATKLNYQKSTHFNLHNFGIKLLTPALMNTGFIKKLKGRIHGRQDDLRELIAICDKVFLIANWFKEILTENGYQSSSLIHIQPISKISLTYIIQNDQPVKNRILFVGRIEPQKGLLLLCKAMNIIYLKGIRLDVFGNIVEENYFKDCRREYVFNYKNTLPHHELLKLLPDYDFLILPSVFTEMYPLVIMEAFHGQLPVIASGAKGNVDVIKEGKNGFIFNYDDYKDLAKVIDKAYSLKEKGWQPEFETNDSHQDNLKEILSYYS